MADLVKLPERLMMEILLRVPPESLVRFKCVSKSWYALINDPKFGGSLQNQNVLLKRVVTNEETGNIETRFSFSKYPLAAGDTSFEDVDFPCFGKEFKNSEIHGHSHGLVCLSLRPRDVFLYNPATRELRKLPPSILLMTVDEFFDPFEDLTSITDAVGFGYDPKSRDFKVVRVVGFAEPPSIFHPSRAEVYDLGKDRWREIKTPIPGRAFWMPSFEMYYQGLYYWWARAEVESVEIIQWFDMSEEVFGQISMPESFQLGDQKIRSMGVLNGSMVLFHYPNHGDEKSLDVWGMVKDGELGSSRVLWSKLFTIGPVFGVDIPLAFVSSDQLLMEDNEGQLILYNFNTQRCKHLPLKGHLGKFEATVFVKTLLSVKGGDNFCFEF